MRFLSAKVEVHPLFDLRFMPFAFFVGSRDTMFYLASPNCYAHSYLTHMGLISASNCGRAEIEE